MRTHVEFQSLGAPLRGWIFRPNVMPAPAVVMAHGFTATHSMTIDKYAEAFCSAGFVVLVYDHRGFGASCGDPRLEYGGRLDSGWVNDVTVALGDTPTPWEPGLCGRHIDVPVLMIVSPEDEMVRASPSVSRTVFESLQGRKEWHSIAGGHFGLLYHPSELFAEARAAQVSFLSRWLIDDTEVEQPRMRNV